MTTFTVWKFDSPEGADRATAALKDAADQGYIKIVDHEVVSWPAGAKRPSMKHSHDERWHHAGWGAFWGLVVGGLFLIPLVGAAAGAGIGALSQATEGVGIRKDDLEKIHAEITEGTSALLVVTDEGDLDRVGERFHGLHSKLIDTNLTGPERQLLLETFGE
jgi:uncharacterized membrane protein